MASKNIDSVMPRICFVDCETNGIKYEQYPTNRITNNDNWIAL